MSYSGSRPEDTPKVDVYVEPDQIRALVAGLQDPDGAGGFIPADLTGAALELDVRSDKGVAHLDRSLLAGTLEIEADTFTQDGVDYDVTAVYVLFTEAELLERLGHRLPYDLRSIHPGQDAPVYRTSGVMHFNTRTTT